MVKGINPEPLCLKHLTNGEWGCVRAEPRINYPFEALGNKTDTSPSYRPRLMGMSYSLERDITYPRHVDKYATI